MKVSITILFTNYKTERFIELNINLIKDLNEYENVHFYVVNNDPKSFIRELNLHKFITIFDNPVSPENHINASYHHASAINYGISKVTTDFLIVLDADFFIVHTNWIKETINFMLKNSKVVFGSPYHPRYFTKYRYFPCGHFMIFDLSQIDKNILDFTPQLNSYQQLQEKCDKLYVPGFLKKFLYNGKSKDTGYLVYEKLHLKDEVNYASLIPVIDKYGWKSKLLASILPEKLSVIPKRKETYSHKLFDVKYIEQQFERWEQYYWGNTPYAIHLRMGGRTFSDHKLVDKIIYQLNLFLNRIEGVNIPCNKEDIQK
jgi:hypothetical protein